MIGFDEMNEFDEHQVMLDMAIRDAIASMRFIAEHQPAALVNVLNELDELIEVAGEIAEKGIIATGIKIAGKR